MGKGGGGTNTTNTVTNSAPPPEVMAQYENVIAQANTAASAPYTTGGFDANNMVAGFSPMQNSSFDTINQAQGIQSPYITQAQNYLNNSQAPIWGGVQQYNPSTMAQYANPYLNQAVGATEAQINNMDQQQQQQIIGNSISSGAWGGDRSAIAQAELANQQSLARNQTISNMENTGFNQQQGEFNTQQQNQIGANEANAWLGTQGSALESNLGTTALNDTLQGASSQLQAGALQQQLQQERYNVPYEQFQAQQAYPFQTGSWLSNISEGIGGSSGGIGSSSSSSPAPSSISQLAGLGLGGYSIYQGMNMGSFNPSSVGAATGNARGGPIKRAPGGFVPSFDLGGGIGGAAPGFTPPNAFMNGVPDASTSYVGAPPSGGHGNMGPPMIKAPSGSTGNATTTGVSEPGGISPATMNAGMRLAGQAMKPTSAPTGMTGMSVTPSGNYAGPAALDDWNASKAGLGDMTKGFTDSTGAANLTPAVNAAGDSVAPGGASAGMDSVALPWQSGSAALSGAEANIGASAGLDGGIASGTALADAGTAAATDAAASAAIDAGAAAAAGTAGAAGAAAVSAADLAPLLLLAKRGGAIHRARGGFTPKHYDDGGSVAGLTPAQTSMDPMQGNLYSQYNNMSIEQLQQINARTGGKNPAIMAALQKKQMSGGTAQPAAQAPMVSGISPQPSTASAQPEGILQQQGMARGGFTPRHYDTGGSDGDADYLTQLTDGPSAAPIGDASPKMPSPSAADPSAMPDHDAWMKNYQNDVMNQKPYNPVNPWFALAQAGFGMAASRNPHILGAAGEGALEGMQNLTAQQKEAASESERRGTLSQQGEQLYNNVIQHKEQMSHENEQLQETERAHKADESLKQKQIDQGKYVATPLGQVLNTKTGEMTGVNPFASGPTATGADGKPLTGDAYKATLDSQSAMNAQKVVDGDFHITPYMLTKNPMYLKMWNDAQHIDPTVSQQRYDYKQEFLKGNSPDAKNIDTFNTVGGHLQLLEQTAKALDNGDSRTINAVKNTWREQMGSELPTNIGAARTMVAGELVKAVTGAGGVTDREKYEKEFSDRASNGQLMGAVDVTKHLINQRIGSAAYRYKNTVGGDYWNNITPEVRGYLKTPAGAAPDTVRVTGPDGKSTGTIPSSRLPDYLANGYKQVQ